MKLTKETLKRIIKEELDKVMNEQELSEAGYTPPQTRGDALGQLEQMADANMASKIRAGAADADLTGEEIDAMFEQLQLPSASLQISTNEVIKSVAPKIFTALANGGSNDPAADARKYMASEFLQDISDSSADKHSLATSFKQKLDLITKYIWSKMKAPSPVKPKRSRFE